MKKIMIVGVFVFAIALTANVAFAECNGGCQQSCPCPDQSNTAFGVKNIVSSSAYNGGNSISGGFVGGGTITTGGAISSATGINAVNSNVKIGSSWGSKAQTNNAKKVTNQVTSAAGNGGNSISGFVVGGGTITTGGAISRAKGINLVNTNVKISR